MADTSLYVDIGWMLRTGHARDGALMTGTLHWQYGSEPAGSVAFSADLTDPESASLDLCYACGPKGEAVHQRIRLCTTVPHFGGRRWWAICPYRGTRALKLYLPAGADCFASAGALRLAWRSQRIPGADRPFEAMFRLQSRLGGETGFGALLPRKPKGMWRCTYERHWKRYEALDDVCSATMDAIMRRL
ncbi:hypothetical protein [Sandarakinorhabdus sp.]|uniref:hypothetical protein n=1 Tax=Sandarakinorhabdus sp. TaxID=1916663 RepID=UPI00286DEFB5|nr:hypothetical protein [Sandarakinorhabdus sp.]